MWRRDLRRSRLALSVSTQGGALSPGYAHRVGFLSGGYNFGGCNLRGLTSRGVISGIRNSLLICNSCQSSCSALRVIVGDSSSLEVQQRCYSGPWRRHLRPNLYSHIRDLLDPSVTFSTVGIAGIVESSCVLVQHVFDIEVGLR